MRVPGRLYCRLQPGSSGFEGRTQRANQAKPTQKVKAPTAETAPLVAKNDYAPAPKTFRYLFQKTDGQYALTPPTNTKDQGGERGRSQG